MFKFNNDHIFTGYLKQLLSSFNLPKCRVYTKEQQQHANEYRRYEPKKIEEKKALEAQRNLLKESRQILEYDLEDIQIILDRKEQEPQNDDLPSKETLENIFAEYTSCLQEVEERLIENQAKLQKCLPECEIIETNYHSSYNVYPGNISSDLPLELKYPATMRYVPYIKNGKLQVYSNNKWFDYHIFSKEHHEFHKNNKIPYKSLQYSYGQKIINYTKNLKIQNTVYDSYTHEYLGDYLRFHRDFANINLMPLYNCFSNRACPHLDINFKLRSGYEVKFKTDQSFENALYKYYMVPVKFFKNYTIAMDSESSIEVCCCIYDEYYNKDSDFANISKLTYQCFSDLQFKTPVLYTKLQNLNEKLFETDSDLCQHEEDLKLILKIPVNNKSSIVILEGDYTTYNDSIAKNVYGSAFLKENNRTIINYEDLNACEYLADKLITPLQLLRTNTGESYPFADRLIEYLVGNAITVNEEIQDNVVRAKTILRHNCNPNVYSIVAEDGIWEPILQCLVYDYINEKHNTNDINHDILGFIDKDVEKCYAASTDNEQITIANVNIYKD